MPTLALLNAVEIGLVYAFVALAVFLTFRIADVADLTVAGSFALGAAVAAAGAAFGLHPWLATGIGAAGGALAGFVTGFVGVRLRTPPLLVSIFVTMAILALVPRITLLAQPASPDARSIFTPFYAYGLAPELTRPLVLFVLTILAAAFIALFLKTDLGLAMRVAGASPATARDQGVRVGAHVIAALVAANAVAAFAGAVATQLDIGGGVDAGVTIFVVGFAALLIGDAMLPRRGIFLAVAGCLLGALVYALAAGLLLRIEALRLTRPAIEAATALAVVAALALPRLRHWRAET